MVTQILNSNQTQMSRTSRTLHDNWYFTQVREPGEGNGTKEGEWLSVDSFPTTVHVELIKLKRIPDPVESWWRFIGLNEWDVQWVGEAEWAFKTTFDVTEDVLSAPNVDLVFEGLDTFAAAKLNGELILETDNQFVAYRVPVKPNLKAGLNELLIHFKSAFKEGRDIEREHSKNLLWNGDSSRLHVRKAQYNYGWDWGPILVTTGPWKPIRLESYVHRITDVDVRSRVSETLDVKLSACFSINGSQSPPSSGTSPLSLSVTLKDPDGSILKALDGIQLDRFGCAETTWEWIAGELKLWYPVGYGEQPLYTAEVVLSDEQGHLLDKKIERIAFRRVRIVEEKLVDQEGLTFLFEVNNIRIFCGGSNWIPADSFITCVSTTRYRAWLKLIVNGNQNMVRVWGGGIYEQDDFYSICDELGLMVWQDFMFGCGQYPAYDSFIDSVREEAIQNVKRLRHHPSVVIFAGNNEGKKFIYLERKVEGQELISDYQLAESYGLELDYSDEITDFRKTNFPSRYIYERVLPEVVHELCDIHYHRGSPYSGHGKPTTDMNYGDLHQWNVWHGTQESWHNWDILSGRFVSEFGMQGFPNLKTIDYWLGGNNTERFPQSRTCGHHNKAAGFERRLEAYLVENFRHGFNLESYVYYTQIMQAETLASAYRLWKRNWKGKGREYTAGALVWQINDCWPVTSWSIVDYFLRPKPAYFAVKRELNSLTVGMTRKEIKHFPSELSAAEFTIETLLDIWATNSTLEEKEVTLEVKVFNLELDEDFPKETWTELVLLPPNSSTELWRGKLPGQPERTRESEVSKPLVVSARLLHREAVLARCCNWPEPFKFLQFPPVKSLGLDVKLGEDGETLTLSSKKPIKGIVLDIDDTDIAFSDQAIDLVPGDPQTIQAFNLRTKRNLKVRHLGDGIA